MAHDNVFPCGRDRNGAAGSDCSMSAIKSPTSSRPTEKRNRSAGQGCPHPRCWSGARPSSRRRPARSPVSRSSCRQRWRWPQPRRPEAHRQHAAKPAMHLPRCYRVPSMRLEARIHHRRDRRMVTEMRGDGHGRPALVTYAHVQRAHAPQQQGGFERAEDAAQHGAQPGRAFQCCAAFGKHDPRRQ